MESTPPPAPPPAPSPLLSTVDGARGGAAATAAAMTPLCPAHVSFRVPVAAQALLPTVRTAHCWRWGHGMRWPKCGTSPLGNA